MNDDSSIGICGATLLYFGTADVVQAYAGVRYSYLTGRGQHIGSGTRYAGPIDNAEVERQMTYVSGASMFVRTQFVRDVGPMCEDYFLYNEEVDWAWRARGKYRLGAETTAVIYHKEGASIGTESHARPASVLSDFFQARNKLLFSRRYVPLSVPVIWCVLAARAVKRFISGHRENACAIAGVLFGRTAPDPCWFIKKARSS
jgi:GT2 family glycosyltransferase